ncbi:hypothetical protein IJJ36_00180 [Candidatus Saccharibacteria bacterium]|nr:hypothetical protein [Candidatus Saccharibacteria bacterium]
MSHFRVNITHAEQPVVPDTDDTEESIVAPDTGVQQIHDTNGITGILLPIFILVFVSFAFLASFIYKKIQTKKNFNLSRQKQRALLVVSVFCCSSVVSFAIAANIKPTNAIDNDELQDAANTLSITTEDVNIDIDIEDEPVYAMAPSKVTVDSGTDFGYTLMAYINNNDLVSENNDVISGLDYSTTNKLSNNTWGISTILPDNQDSEVFHGLPTTAQDAMVIKSHPEVAPTEAGEETTIYYGVYATPDLPEGTYQGVTINYIAVSDFTDQDIAITYHSNGLYFDEEKTETVNTVIYRGDCEEPEDEYDEATCLFSVAKGQYREPIGYQGSWYFGNTYPVENDDDVIEFLDNNSDSPSFLGRTIDVLASNDQTVIFAFIGNFVEDSDNILDQVNILSYTYDEEVDQDYRQPILIEGEYIRPIDFNGTWYFNFEWPLGEEYIIDQAIFIPLGTQVIFSQSYDGPSYSPVWIEYEANANGDYVGNMPYSPEEHEYDWMDGMYWISDQEPYREGYIFLGWEYEGSLYQPGEMINYYGGDGATIYLTAQWEQLTVSIHYDGGDPAAVDIPSSQECGQYSSCPLDQTAPSLHGYSFLGWEHNGTLYQPGETIDTFDYDIYLTAQWEEIPFEPEP